LIRNKVTLFCEFARINRNKQNVTFIIEQQYADDYQMKKDVGENYEIPSRLGKPYAMNI
jgi:hypothetical protein